MEILKDFYNYFLERKKLWLAPVVIVLLILGFILVFSEGSVLGGFIYTLF